MNSRALRSSTVFAAGLFLCGIAFAKEIPPDIQKQIDQCLTQKDGEVCYLAGNSLFNFSMQENKDLVMKLLKLSCDAENMNGCHSYGAHLMDQNDESAQQEALIQLEKNCDRGYLISCEYWGYHLAKRGKNDEARSAYYRICSGNESLRGCEQVGKLTTTEEQRKELAALCDTKKEWACMALGHAELKANNRKAATSAFVEGCRQNGTYHYWLCEAAAELIVVPPDANDYIEKQKLCIFYGGEEAYDEERGKEIEKGIKEACADRSAELETLRRKYKDSPEVLLILENYKTE